ncbi:hypothetical protein T484DRAFT_1924477 [Baffinella frigidus]|nr:hypothetical protein T484DRAFT_1924477 [Cryptophyta sp. CCMP2293]
MVFIQPVSKKDAKVSQDSADEAAHARDGPPTLREPPPSEWSFWGGGYESRHQFHANTGDRHMMVAGTSRVAESRNRRSYGDGLLWTDADGAAGMQAKCRSEPVVLVNAFPRHWSRGGKDCWGVDTLQNARQRQLEDDANSKAGGAAHGDTGPRGRGARPSGLIEDLRRSHERVLHDAEARLGAGEEGQADLQSALQKRMADLTTALDELRNLRAAAPTAQR